MLSFVVPAHNEEASVASVVAAIAAAATAAGAAHEIIVVDDASTDATAARAAAAGARVVPVAHRQIAATRNAGARAARGDILVFVDADTLIGADVVAGLMRALAAGAIGGGAAIRFDEPVPRWVNGRCRPSSGCSGGCASPAAASCSARAPRSRRSAASTRPSTPPRS